MIRSTISICNSGLKIKYSGKALVLIIFCLGTWYFLHNSAKITPAQEITNSNQIEAQITFDHVIFSDSFQNGLTNWQDETQTQEYWSVDNAILTAHVYRGSTRAILVPKNTSFVEEWNKISENNWSKYEFSFDFKQEKGTDINFIFNYVDPKNWYEFHIKNGSYQVVRVENGTVTFRSFGELMLYSNTLYHIKIRVIEEEISLFVNDRLIGSHQDWTYSAASLGKIGLRATTGNVFPTTVHFSNISLRVPYPKPPNKIITPYKQTDPRWASDVYDHANLWNDTPYMRNWGCLTTSIAMVMQYYGMTELPGGEKLNPASLNEWLRSQSDGYIGNGLVNWHAVTRLTRLIHESKGTPKLEYSVHMGAQLEPAYQEVAKKQPVIFNIPGHFLVGSGLSELANGTNGQNTSKTKDIVIHDPFFPFNRLSEHGEITTIDQAGKESVVASNLISTRILTPSYTNLSYFMIVHDPKVTLVVTKNSDSNNADLNNAESNDSENVTVITLSDQVFPKVDSQQSQNETIPQVISLIPKPKAGKYTVLLQKDSPSQEKIAFYSYNSAADVVINTLDTWITPIPLRAEIDFDPTVEINHTDFQTTYSTDQFRNELYALYKNYHTTLDWHATYVVAQLHAVLEEGDFSPLQKKVLAEQIFYRYSYCLSPTLISFLEDRITLLDT